jgi:hypothetical protein
LSPICSNKLCDFGLYDKVEQKTQWLENMERDVTNHGV